MYQKYGLLLLILISFSTPLQAQPFWHQLAQSAPNDPLRAIVIFHDQTDLTALKSRHEQADLSLQQRHQDVVESLQETAKRTQFLWREVLEHAQIEQQIVDYQPLWIVNGFLVEATPAFLGQLASHPEVAEIHPDYDVELHLPVDESPAAKTRNRTAEDGLLDLNAHLLWQEGVTGQGRLVCHIDSGVDLTHPALGPRWRGNNGGTPEESWLDPANGTLYPTDPPVLGGHGTHTMGILCAADDATADTVGVAFGAEWISAGNFFHMSGAGGQISDCILAFQWAIDPDGDPATMHDVPDVISNSWGFSEDSANDFDPCENFFNDVIDAVEAAGVATVFAAGNRGDDGLTFPANRIASETNAFAVGALTMAGNNTATISGKGPSQCEGPDDLRIKPEVAARGINVRSCALGDGYTAKSGTSQATPHVAGAIALLRQINPEATVDELKWALMSTAVDLDEPGNDNESGYGRIDVYAAAMTLGQQITGTVNLSDNPDDSGVRITIDEINRTAWTRTDGQFTLFGVPTDTFTVRAYKPGYTFGTRPEVVVLPDQNTNNINFVLTPTGPPPTNLSVANPADGGLFLSWSAPPEFASSYQIYRRDAYESDFEWLTEVIYTETNYVDEDVVAGRPYVYQVTATYAFPNGESVPSNEAGATAGPYQLLPLQSDFEANDANLQVQIIDPGSEDGYWEWGSPTSGPGSAFSGVNVWATNLNGSYADESDQWLLTPYLSLQDTPSAYLLFHHWYELTAIDLNRDGVNVALTTNGGHSWQVLEPEGGYPAPEIRGLNYQPGFAGTSDGWELCRFPLNDFLGDVVQIRFRLGADGVFLYDGWYLDDLYIGESATHIDDEDHQNVAAFHLFQNQPNPFNPSTTIQFALPYDARIQLTVYDVTGREVARLADGERSAGTHRVSWDGANRDGAAVASGVYFYRLETDAGQAQQRRLVLLR